MIKSRFSKAIIPLAFTTAVSGGMLVKNAISEENKENKIEQTQKATNPMENPAVLGTIFTLGLIGTTSAAALGKSVDLRYKGSHEKIDDIYNLAVLKESDYDEAFEEECKELDAQGINYDKEELRKEKYTPLSKEAVLENINSYKTDLRRVTENVKYNKQAKQQLEYLIQEINSGVEYDKDIDEDINIRMHYFFDKATLPQKEWVKKEKQYRNEYKGVDFDRLNGIPLQSKITHYVQEAVANIANDKITASRMKPQVVLDNLNKIKEEITKNPEILNKYDREECLNLIEKSVNRFNISGEFDDETYAKITHIFVSNQQTY